MLKVIVSLNIWRLMFVVNVYGNDRGCGSKILFDVQI
jgi:hypothetical protein